MKNQKTLQEFKQREYNIESWLRGCWTCWKSKTKKEAQEKERSHHRQQCCSETIMEPLLLGWGPWACTHYRVSGDTTLATTSVETALLLLNRKPVSHALTNASEPRDFYSYSQLISLCCSCQKPPPKAREMTSPLPSNLLSLLYISRI